MLAKQVVRTIGTALWAFGVVGFFAAAAAAQAPPQGPPVDVARGKFVSAQERGAMKAFRQKGAPKSEAELKRLGERLFAQARLEAALELKDDDTGHLIHVGRDDPSRHYRVDKATGSFSFNKGMKAYLDDKATEGLPRGDAAVEMAKRHLAELGLMPERPEEMVVRHIGGLRQVDVGADGKPVERDKLVTVHFGRQIGGVDVGGPGSKIVVELGANGELVALNRRWIEVTEDAKGPGDFVPETGVREEVVAKLKSVASRAKRIDAQAPDFGYFDDGKGHIEPAYFVDAELYYDLPSEEDPSKVREHKEKFHGAVPALKRSGADFDQLAKADKPPARNDKGDKDSPAIKDET